MLTEVGLPQTIQANAGNVGKHLPDCTLQKILTLIPKRCRGFNHITTLNILFKCSVQEFEKETFVSTVVHSNLHADEIREDYFWWFSGVTGMSRQLRHLCPETISITVTEDVVFYPRYFTFVVRVRLSMPCPVHSKMINSLTQARRKQNLRPVYSPMDSSGRCLLTVQFPCSYFFNLKPEVRKT